LIGIVQFPTILTVLKLFPGVFMGKRVTILAADPGTANFGYCVLSAELELGKKPTNLKVLQFGKINCTVKSLTGTATTEAYMYSKSLDLLIEEFNPSICS
jgi:Holliday junction resolvasome RuvABC endonuclease subunit